MENKGMSGRTLLTSVIVALVISFGIWHWIKRSGGVTDAEAYIIAKDFVKDGIDTPSTAEFPGEYSTRKTGKNRWEVSGDVDAQNGFGAMKRAKFFVELEYNGGEWEDKNNWTLINFDLRQ